MTALLNFHSSYGLMIKSDNAQTRIVIINSTNEVSKKEKETALPT